MHDRGSPDVRGLEAVAYDQDGYFTAADARAHGVSRQLLDHHVRQGRFERIRRGLLRIRGFPTTEHDEMREKWLAVGAEKAVLCDVSALALLELSDNIPDAVHLLVPRRHRGLRRPPGTVIHTRPDDEDVSTVWRDGLPLTAPARSLVDVLERLQPEQAAMAVRQALDRGLLTERQLRAEAARRGKAGAVEAVGDDQVRRYDSGMAQVVKATKSEIKRRRAAAEAARGMLGRNPGRSFTDELIAERRAEARADDREDEARQRRGRG